MNKSHQLITKLQSTEIDSDKIYLIFSEMRLNLPQKLWSNVNSDWRKVVDNMMAF